MHTERESVDLVGDDVVARVARAALIAALMGATAYVAIPYPFSPADVTLQTLVVFLAGLYLGPVWGTFSIAVYLLAGAVGVPVFSGGRAGLGHLFGPTGGFLFSFPVAAALIGGVVHRGTRLRDPASVSYVLILASLAAAMVLVYASGSAYYSWSSGVALSRAVYLMAILFVPADLLKIVVAVAIVKSGVIDPA